MTEIVYNACYGGFGLSDEGCREYLRRKGWTWTEEEYYSLTVFHVDGQEHWCHSNIERTDPVLIELVKEDAVRYSGRHAKLKIVELEPGTEYIIDEYDGYESVLTKDSMNWILA